MSVVATLGHFDGLHLGHQALIRKMEERAKQRDSKTLLILFEPYPRELFAKDGELPRIQTLTDKLLKLREFSTTPIHIVYFNHAVAAETPEMFIQHTLQKLGVTELVIGKDFRFGQNRAGGIEDLEQAGIKPIMVSEVPYAGQRVSSTRIRECLAEGDFTEAALLLGSPYSITGRVIHGAKHGRLLGFPTLNLALRKKIPLSGVYAVRVHGLGPDVKTGVANIGRRPTVNPLAHPLLEVFVLDFDEMVYGRRVTVEFVRKVRDEKKFESLEALKSQIAKDVAVVSGTTL